MKKRLSLFTTLKNARNRWRRLISLVLPFGVLVGVAAGLWAVMTLVSPGSTQAAWMDQGWGFRQRIAFTNSGSLDYDKKMSLSIDTATMITAGQLQSACQDLRFTDQSGKVLKYYINTAGGACNTSSTNVFVLLPVISTSINNIYMYYGNPRAAAGTEQAQFGQSTFSPGAGPTANTAEIGTAPVAWWKFDDATGTSAKDSSTNANTGTLTSMASPPSATSGWQTEDLCVSGKCLRFDGTNDNVVVSSDVSSLKLTSNVTLQAWVRTNGKSGGNQAVITKWGTTTHQYWIGFVGTSLRMYVSGDGTSNIYRGKSNSGILDNKWHSITAIYSSSGPSITIYVDGAPVTLDETSGTIPSSLFNGTTVVQIGRDAATGDAITFDGSIDEPKIYNYARSAAQVKSDFLTATAGIGSSSVAGANLPFLTNGLMGYWKMDEASWTNNCSTSSVVDSSGNGNNGSACPNSTGPTGAGPGKYGNAGTFDGTDDYVDVPNSTSTNITGSAITLSVWLRSTNTAIDFQRIIMKQQNAGGDGYNMQFFSTTRRPQFYVHTTAGVQSLVANTALSNSTWYHVMGIYDGSTIKIYINGKLDNSAAASGTIVGNASNNLTFGQSSNHQSSTAFNGNLDDIRLYNRALSPTEVSLLYTFAPGPVAYYKFEEAGGSSYLDSSGYGNTGTLGGSSFPRWTSDGKLGKAANLNGTDNNASISETSSLDITNTISLGGWVYPTQTGVYQLIALKGPGNGGNRQYGLYLSGAGTNQIYFQLAGLSVGNDVTISTPWVINSWNHVFLTYDGATVKIYLNGKVVYSAAATGGLTHYTGGLWLGCEGTNSYCMKGKVDEIKIYNYARTQAQISEDIQGTSNLFNNTLQSGSATSSGTLAQNTKLSSAIMHLKFDEGQGTTAINTGSLGSQYNGTLSGFSSPATSTSGWTLNGKVNRGLVFDGTDDSVTVPLMPPTAFSASMWFNSNAAYSSGIDVNRGLLSTFSGSFNGIYVGIGGGYGGCVSLMFWTDGNTFYCINTLLSASTWYHITVVSTGSTVSIYINGKLDRTVTASTTHANTLVFGRTRFNYDYWNGYIDEPKVFGYALSPSEVMTNYNNGLSTDYGVSGLAESATGVDGAGNAPVGYWTFEEKSGTTAKDTSGGGNTGTLTSDPSWVSGKIGTGVNFAPSNSYVSVADASALNITGNLTVEAWVKPNVIDSSSRVFLEKGDGTTAANRQYALRLNSSNKWEFFLYTGSTTNSTADSATTPSVNRWDHVVGVRSSNTIYIYVNGVLRSSTSVSGSTNSSSSILAFGRAGAASSGYFGGQIDEVKIYNYARTASQIAYDYNRGAPVLWYKMDECQGTTINDSSGNGNVGALSIGGSGTQTAVGTCTTASTAWGNGATGKINSAINLDGTNDFITVPTSPSLSNMSGLTVATWIKLTSLSGFQTIVNKWGSGGNSYVIYLGSGGFIRFFGAGSGGGDSASGLVTTGSWQHVAVVYTGSVVQFYINGIYRGQITYAAGTIPASTSTLLVGTDGGFPLNGAMDDFRIYNYALSASQVKNVYTNGASVLYAPSTGTP